MACDVTKAFFSVSYTRLLLSAASKTHGEIGKKIWKVIFRHLWNFNCPKLYIFT